MIATSSVTAAAGGVNLDFDATLFVQVAFIIILWVVLKPVLFDPLLKLFEEREKRTEGAIKKARRIDDASIEAKAEYDGAMAKSGAEGTAEREKMRAESLRQENELLTKVRSEAQKKIDAGRVDANKELEEARAAIAPHAREIAKQVASRVLGREVSG